MKQLDKPLKSHSHHYEVDTYYGVTGNTPNKVWVTKTRMRCYCGKIQK